jgi:hypothetical protein
MYLFYFQIVSETGLCSRQTSLQGNSAPNSPSVRDTDQSTTINTHMQQETVKTKQSSPPTVTHLHSERNTENVKLSHVGQLDKSDSHEVTPNSTMIQDIEVTPDSLAHDEPPMIVNLLPQSLNILKGSDIKLHGTFVGRPRPNIHWYMDECRTRTELLPGK